jgi:hypothetical protein
MNSLAAIALEGSPDALMRFGVANGFMPIFTYLFGLPASLAHAGLPA